MRSKVAPAPAVQQKLPDVRVIWGRLLLGIKKEGKFMLHSACVTLGKISLNGDTLVVAVPSRLDYDLLKKPQNSGELVDTLHKLGYNLSIEFILDETAGSDQDKFAQIKKILGADITII